jgi:AcrR family transcriptional regulator
VRAVFGALRRPLTPLPTTCEPVTGSGGSRASQRSQPRPGSLLPSFPVLENDSADTVRGALESKSRSEARDERARELLVSSARFIFERDGFHDARIVDIAAAAKVGVGTFYRHFPSKVDLFCAVIAHTFDEIHTSGATRAVDPDNPALHIDLANRRFLHQYRRHARLHALLEQLAPVDDQCRTLYLAGRVRAVKRIVRFIEALQEAGTATPDLDAHHAARMLVAMTNNFAHLCFTLGEHYDEDVAVATLNRLWTDGLGIRKVS